MKKLEKLISWSIFLVLCFGILLLPVTVQSAENPVGDQPQVDLCFQISPFCNQLYINLNGMLIEGYDDECGGDCPYLVGGAFYGVGQWNITLDFQDDACGHAFEYGIIIGAGLSGTLYRYYPDGTMYGSDPTLITLLPCEEAVPATKGPISQIE
jgi:hypothetical protein